MVATKVLVVLTSLLTLLADPKLAQCEATVLQLLRSEFFTPELEVGLLAASSIKMSKKHSSGTK